MFCGVVSFSVQKSESVIRKHVSTLVLVPFRIQVKFPVLDKRCLLVICDIYCHVYMAVPTSLICGIKKGGTDEPSV